MFVIKLFIVVVINGNYLVCGVFVVRGGDFNGYINGMILLYMVVFQGYEKVLEVLVEGGVDFILKDRRGENLIFLVIMLNIKSKVRICIIKL